MCTADTKQEVNQIDVAMTEASAMKLAFDLGMNVLSDIEHSLPRGTEERKKFDASLNTMSGCRICICKIGKKTMVIFQPSRNCMGDINHIGIVRTALESALKIKFSGEDPLELFEFNPGYSYQTAITRSEVVIVLRVTH